MGSDSRHATTTPTAATALLDRALQLPLTIESVDSRHHEFGSEQTFHRVTTQITLSGAGAQGRGEDVAYDSTVHPVVARRIHELELPGTWTLGSFSHALDERDLAWKGSKGFDDKPAFHRWGLESAALDLALRQNGATLHELAGVPLQPVRYCLSMGLGTPASSQKVLDWLKARPQTRFKLDTSSSWSEQLIAELAATDAVAVVDFKGLYTGEWADNDPDPVLYSAVARGLPQALLEDARLTPQTRQAVGADGLTRLSWDFPVTSPKDVRDLEHTPAAINIKPSRFGSLRLLLETVDLCLRRGIPLYAGGQFELGVGRAQVQHLAALFFADADNDIAPSVFHSASPGDDVPGGPVQIPEGPGFGFDAA